MNQNFNYCLQQVLLSEGGYTNDPHDPGKATNLGITIGDYRSYINPNGTDEDVKNLTKAQAGVIYKKRYWDACNCDSLPSGVDYCVFDNSVLSGVARSLSEYKIAEGKSPVDCINEISDERLAFYRSLTSEWPYYGKGWTSRVQRVRSDSISLAGASNQPGGSITTVETEVQSVTNIFTTMKGFFKDNFKTNIIPVGAGVTAMFTQYWPYILAGALVASGLIWLVLHLYERKINA